MYVKQISKLIMSTKELRNNYKKNLFKRFDICSNSLLNGGVIFFGITINIVREKGCMDLPVYDNNTARTYISRFLNSLCGIEFIDCSFGSVEIGKDDIPHIYFVVGFRIPENVMPFIRQKIESCLYKCDILDYKISYLPKFIDVTESLRYLSKDFNKECPLDVCFFFIYGHATLDIADFFEDYREGTASIEDYREGTASILSGKAYVFFFGEYFNKEHIQYEGFHSFLKLCDLLSSFRKDKNKEIIVIVDYLNFFFALHNIFILKGSLYQKIDVSLNSYRYLGPSEIVKSNFIEYMTELDANISESFDIYALYLTFSNNSDEIIETLSSGFSNSNKTLNLDVLEFKDGLYLAYNDTFIDISNKIEIDSLSEKFLFTRYYSYSYKTYLCEKDAGPKLWQSKLLQNLSKEDFIFFSLIFRSILFSSDEKQTKKNTLFLTGVPDSGKYFLVLDIAKLSAGIESESSLSSDGLFFFENLLDKTLAIIEEVDYSIKLMNPAVFSSKAREKKAFAGLKLLAAATSTDDIENLLGDDALQNTVYHFIFDKACFITNKEYEQIVLEIPKILLFCNKLYFTILKKSKEGEILSPEVSKFFLNEKR
jgi:hypothetical protein